MRKAILALMLVGLAFPYVTAAMEIDSAYVREVRESIRSSNEFEDKYEIYYGDKETQALLGAAVIKYTETIQEDPDNIDAYLQRGFTEYALRHYENALKDFTIYLETEPSNQIARYRRAQCFAILRQYDLAIKDFKIAFLKPDESSSNSN